MSTKRIFDDMYLFLKEANLKSGQQDVMNGLPQHGYLEICSKYWNLIYK